MRQACEQNYSKASSSLSEPTFLYVLSFSLFQLLVEMPGFIPHSATCLVPQVEAVPPESSGGDVKQVSSGPDSQPMSWN